LSDADRQHLPQEQTNLDFQRQTQKNFHHLIEIGRKQEKLLEQIVKQFVELQHQLVQPQQLQQQPLSRNLQQRLHSRRFRRARKIADRAIRDRQVVTVDDARVVAVDDSSSESGHRFVLGIYFTFSLISFFTAKIFIFEPFFFSFYLLTALYCILFKTAIFFFPAYSLYFTVIYFFAANQLYFTSFRAYAQHMRRLKSQISGKMNLF
jgi:hypothetical protein